MLAHANQILIIDDDVELVQLLKDYLELEGFSVTGVHNGFDGLSKMHQNRFDIVILDVMMPGMSGTEVLTEIRKNHTTPVLMLTARGDSIDKILGLELGADDYVAKPCPPRELVARIRAILRRSSSVGQAPGQDPNNPLIVDMRQRKASINNQTLNLTSTELTILDILSRQAGHPVPKADFYLQVLGRPMGRYDRAIDVHISSIRKKIEEVCADKIVIESVRGIGYQLIVR